MKKFIIFSSLLVLAILFISCSGANAPTYQPPLYKTVPKTLTIENIIDERKNVDHISDFTNITRINQQIINRFIQTQIFQRVNQAAFSTFNDDYTLSAKLIDYGMDKSMTFWTVFPDALVATTGVVVGIVFDSGLFTAAIAGMAGVDFLINGLGGKRLYDHDYIASMNFVLKNKDKEVLLNDTISYKI